jgi:hypothetical protein
MEPCRKIEDTSNPVYADNDDNTCNFVREGQREIAKPLVLVSKKKKSKLI